MLKATFTFTTGLPKLRREEFDKIRGLAAERFGLDLKPGKEELVLSRPEARLWCAAAATGEEPYSIVFTLLEAAGMAAASRIHLVATDISTRALEIAKRGVYADDRFAGVPQAVRRRYLLRGHEAAEGHDRVRPQVQRCIEFRRLNLIEKIWHPESFPVIFCRNVLIHLNRETRREVVNQLIHWLEPGGYLFVGHAETLSSRDYALEYVQPAIYRKPAESAWRRPRGGGRG